MKKHQGKAVEALEPHQGEREQLPIYALRDDIERWLDSTLPHGWPRRLGWPSWGELTRMMEALGPRIDVIDQEQEVLVRAEVPGMEKKDLELDVTASNVRIRGSLATETAEEEGEFYRREISRSAFSRTVELPAEVDPEQTKATFNNGILDIRIPKITAAQRFRVPID